MGDYEGILIIDKEEGFTSFDVIAKLRGILKMKKIGHAGTLDPMATGVLPVFLGAATKAINFLENHNKRYLAEFRLGIETDTQDITGKVLNDADASHLSGKDVENCLKLFRGKVMQVPPMYSAVKVDGKRLYELARAGKEVEVAPREIEVYSLDLVGQNPLNGDFIIDIACSSGTYIRTLAHDIGKSLGSFGTLTKLRRTGACGYDISGAHPLNLVESCGKDVADLILPMESAFLHMQKIILEKESAKRFYQGQKIKFEEFFSSGKIPEMEFFTVYFEDIFIGIGETRDGIVKAKRIFLQEDF